VGFGVTSNPQILRGSIFVYRVFDIAEEIDLTRVEQILSNEPDRTRLSLARSPRQSLVMRNPPIRLRLGEMEVSLGNGDLARAEVFATLFDYGVISLFFQIPLNRGTPWSKLMRHAEALVGDSKGGEEFDTLARRKAVELTELLKPALKAPAERKLFEDYVIYFLEEVEGFKFGRDLLEKVDLSALILGENKEILAERAKEGILENTYQYAENDLVVIDWNSAVVLEPSGQKDILDVLEFALTHLLEFRYYDDVLDHRLGELYDRVESQRARGWGRFFGLLWNEDFAKISRDANARFIEFSELIERIDNSLKVVGDFYLAVIFRGGIRRFRIPDWQQNVTRKINTLARVSELLQGEINVQRGFMLEFVIIGLITFEVISAILNRV
jgi:hypothetical protein